MSDAHRGHAAIRVAVGVTVVVVLVGFLVLGVECAVE